MSAFDTAGLQLDNQLCFKLYAASRAVIRATSRCSMPSV